MFNDCNVQDVPVSLFRIYYILFNHNYTFFQFFYDFRNGLGLSVLGMDIEWLGLTSLKKVRNGNVAFAWNKNLCYVEDLDLSPIFTFPTQLLKLKDNKKKNECGKYKATCGAGHSHF